MACYPKFGITPNAARRAMAVIEMHPPVSGLSGAGQVTAPVYTMAPREGDAAIMANETYLDQNNPPAERISAFTSNLAMVVACAFIILMMFHVTLDVLGKFLFTAPAPATLETVMYYYMVALVFLPFAYIARGEGHIFVELFTRKMSPRPRFFLDAVMGLLTLIWVGALAWYTGEEAVTVTIDGEFQETAEGILHVWPSRWFLPLGSGIMAFAVILRMTHDFRMAFRRIQD
ncbi:MAG: TRAP transporter small permease [Rhodospirillales bacterium]|jgi:TRAP-type C4-dicarboxylate transport system permease small subunit|nr:hypothetical protein [Rhodospirillaceae bacterium]MAF48613.1 hypothetical protein [Rhodospirillaceae bacterium]MDP6430178.1 TRAP transporter small permease [Rhodospirillales bacterium]MDP6642746.1 TRAP transporter small permease [Rhodospirillales bacterium]|tara:strand:+ start:475 stop:1167 length:693 start_codon:yes stop_codon:yes gene_type:complete